MLNRKKQLSTLLLLMAVLIAKTQVLSLDSILQTIQNNHPSMKMFDADIRSMDEAARGAGAWMPPEFGAGLWMTPYSPAYWKSDGSGRSGMGQFMVSAQQEFPNRAKQKAETKYMEAMSSVQQQKKLASLNELYATAKKYYYEWVILKKKIRVVESDEKILAFIISNAEIRYKNGMEKLNACYKAKAALGTLQNMKLSLAGEIVQRQTDLNTLMGQDKLKVFDVDTILPLRNYSDASFDSTRFIHNRSDIRAIDNDISLTYLKQQMEKTKLKPQFGLRYDHMFAWAGQPWQFSLMGMVKIPFASWSSKMYKANVTSLGWQAESLKNERETLLNESSGMAYHLLTQINTKKKQISLFEDNIIPALQRNYQSMELAYEQNTEQLFMLLDAWDTLNMTQLEYLDQWEQLLGMQTDLDKILELK